MMKESQSCLCMLCMLCYKPGGLKRFTYQYLISFLGVRENNLLLSLLRNGSSFMYPFVFWRFYKVLLESKVLFWKYQDKLQGCPKPGNLSFRNMKYFQPPILIKRTRFSTTKVEVTKPDLRRIYLDMIPDQRNARRYIDILGN